MSLEIETVSEIFPEVRTSTASGHLEFIVHCPKFHRKGGKYKLSINSDTGAFICHDCGYKGNAFVDFFDIGAQFFRGAKIHRTDTTKEGFNQRFSFVGHRKEWKDGVPSPGILKKVSSLELDHPAVEYLELRNISTEQADSFGIKYCCDGYFHFSSKMGTTSGRLIFPVIMNNKLTGWQARQIDLNTKKNRYVWKGDRFGWWEVPQIITTTKDVKYQDYEVPKYYTCPGMQRSRSLLNFDSAIKNKNFVVVVEGPIDCIKVGNNCVATFGKRLTKDQIRILCSNWSRVLMLLDSEVDEKEDWFKMLEKSFDGVYFNYMKLKGFNDPGEASRQEIWKQITKNFGDLNDYRP